MCLRKMLGTLPASTSRSTPPPTPVIMPTNSKRPVFFPGPADSIPSTVNAASPSVSERKYSFSRSWAKALGLRSWVSFRMMNTARATRIASTAQREFRNTRGGIWPIIRSRSTPPPMAVTRPSIVTPNRSILCRTPSIAPDTAKATVPSSSNIAKSTSITSTSASSGKGYKAV